MTAIVEREGNGYVSFCPELDIASQGDTVQEVRENLREALELFCWSYSLKLRCPQKFISDFMMRFT